MSITHQNFYERSCHFICKTNNFLRGARYGLKLYTSVAKGLKLKVTKLEEIINYIGKSGTGASFLLLPPSPPDAE